MGKQGAGSAMALWRAHPENINALVDNVRIIALPLVTTPSSLSMRQKHCIHDIWKLKKNQKSQQLIPGAYKHI
jgi:hypothetical protein